VKNCIDRADLEEIALLGEFRADVIFLYILLYRGVIGRVFKGVIDGLKEWKGFRK